MSDARRNDKCFYCGGNHFETRRVEYLYSRRSQYLLVPDMPAEVCLDCGTIYYSGPALLEVERRFMAIQQHQAEPDRLIELPVMLYESQSL